MGPGAEIPAPRCQLVQDAGRVPGLQTEGPGVYFDTMPGHFGNGDVREWQTDEDARGPGLGL